MEIDRMSETQTTVLSGWRKPIPPLSIDSHETRIAALEADIEELRQALTRLLPIIEELETWIGD
ncbi:MAG TPA: hypothetical protein VLA24_09220 [Pseudomonadales bacterium]|nr:hypothetical protein [Pseudomonadales bacterium]